jgi:ketosteroid isomerase-like protein
VGAAPSDRGSAVAEVLAAFDALDRAFERNDLDAIRSLCLEGLEFLGSASAEQAGTLDELVALFRRFEGDLGTFTVRWAERRVRLEGDTAWVVAAGEATWRREAQVDRFPYRLTGGLVRREDGWRWALHHGSEPVDRL